MTHYEEFNFEMEGLSLLASLYTLRAIDNCIQTQRTCNFCITKILNTLTDDIPHELAAVTLSSIKEVVNAILTE